MRILHSLLRTEFNEAVARVAFHLRIRAGGKEVCNNYKAVLQILGWVWGVFLSFQKKLSAQKQTVKEAFEPNQITLLKKSISQAQVIGIHIGAAELSSTSYVVQECRLGKLKNLTVLKICYSDIFNLQGSTSF